MGTGLVYMLASALYRARQYPFLIGGAAMVYGYLRASFRRERRYEAAGFRAFLRRYQSRALLFGKGIATAELEEAGAPRGAGPLGVTPETCAD